MVADSSVKLGLLALLFRLFGAFFVRTYFNPDEYWQSVEVAHEIVFGYGYRTWEWQAFAQLRGYSHPLLFAALYKVLQLLQLDSAWLVHHSPRILQAFIASIGDVYLFKLSERFFGRRSARWALFCQFVDWFYFFVIVRTYSNCVETVLMTVAMYYWPWPSLYSSTSKTNLSRNRFKALCIAAAAIIMRPTAIFLWMMLGLIHLWTTKDKLLLIFQQVLPIAIISISCSSVIDRVFYGQWTIVPLNFVLFNVLQGGSGMYGTHPWHWYFSQGFVAILGLFTPFFLLGVYVSRRVWPAIVVLLLSIVYSFNPHKEFRFLLPALPLAFMYSGHCLALLQSRFEHRKRFGTLFLPSIAVLLCANIAVASFFSLVHQRGPVAVMEHLSRRLQSPGSSLAPVRSVDILAYCHSTPFYSSIHRQIPLRQLDCSPRFKDGVLVGDRSQSDSEKFVQDPARFVRGFYADDDSDLPSHIVLFSEQEPQLRAFLDQKKYRLEKQFFNSFFGNSEHVLLFDRNV